MTEKEIREYQYLKLDMMEAYWQYKKWCILWDHLSGVKNIWYHNLDDEMTWDYVDDYDASGKLVTYLEVCTNTEEGYKLEGLIDNLLHRIGKIVHDEIEYYKGLFEDFKREVIDYW